MLRQSLLALSHSDRMKAFVSRSRVGWWGARRFVAGETLDDAMAVVAELNAAGLLATLDHLGENVATRPEAEVAARAYLDALERIHSQGARSGVSLKLTALGLDLGDDVATELLLGIVTAAEALDPPVFVRIDMEDSQYTQRTLDIFRRVFSRHPTVGIVVQSYLFRTDADVAELCGMGASVRLVKGAYLEPPTIAYPEKEQVDAAYVRQAERLLSPEARAKGVRAAIASHDEAIIAWVRRHAREGSIPKDAFEFQMLYGIRRDLQSALVADGFAVRVYVPYGRQWYPYFMRRLAERPENLGFLVQSVVRELKP